VVMRTYAWNDRKRKFSREQIELALGILADKGWLKRQPAESIAS